MLNENEEGPMDFIMQDTEYEESISGAEYSYMKTQSSSYQSPKVFDTLSSAMSKRDQQAQKKDKQSLIKRIKYVPAKNCLLFCFPNRIDQEHLI